jgi:pyruvate/2-oxoglutarate dehydrogenase complex dihydrolipoamide dehydrogenase (E3) component
METNFHTIIIGAGSGGLTVAVGLANLGKRVALIEAKHIGGDCTNVGCVPSKTLIHQAAEHAATNPARVLAEVRRKRDALREKETHEFGEIPNLTLIFARARLVAATQVLLTKPDGSTATLTAEQIVIATGARPRQIPIPGLPPERTLTNESVFEIPYAPRHLAILGGGIIGVELAFAFRKLGSQVSIITTASRVLNRSLPEVSVAIEAALNEKGISVYNRSSAQSYDLASETLHIQQGQQTLALSSVDYVLVAIGRERNIDNLGLEQVGVAVDPRSGIATDSFGRTNIPSIYAIGDVTSTSAFTHSANAQGRRVVQRIAFPFLPANAPEPPYPSAIFSEPEVASVGLSVDQIAAHYHPNIIHRIRVDLVTQTDRGYTDDLARGFIVVDAIRLTGRILAVTIVGPRASEMISFFTLAIQERISLFALFRVVYPYPTFSSGIAKVADAFVRATLPNLRQELPNYLRYRWARPLPPSNQSTPTHMASSHS